MGDIDVEIRITNEELVKSGGRQTTHYWIDIEFGQRSWTIKRRFSECLELHRVLEKLYGKRIPKFPIELRTDSRQASASSRVKQEYAEEKREKLGDFFAELARCDGEILSSEFFTAFISEDNEVAAEFLVERKRNDPLHKVCVVRVVHVDPVRSLHWHVLPLSRLQTLLLPRGN